jgi:stage V sporulation protein B
MIKDKFIRGALILTIAGLSVKVLGAVNRILLSRLLGGEGIGLYQMAYPVYLMILSISSAGVPIAISILVSEKVAKRDFFAAKRVFKLSFGIMFIMGLFFSALLYFTAKFLILAGILRDTRAYYAIVALTPAVFFATLLASFRGYFQGFQEMTPPAISQILEQFVRVMTMLALAYYLLPMGLEYAAAGAAFGALPGSVTGLIVLSIFYYKNKEKFNKKSKDSQIVEKWSKLTKRLVKLALPVSAANLLVPLVMAVDMLIIPNRLEVAGFSIKEATTLFGYLAGMAYPLVMMATIPTLSITTSIVPAISEFKVLNDPLNIQKKINTALRLLGFITIPAAVGMFVLGTPIASCLYSASAAGPIIKVLAPAVILFGLQQVTTGILQGLGMTVIPMLNMIFSIIVKAILVWILVADPSFGIIGATIASVLNFGLVAGLNIWFIIKLGKVAFPLNILKRIFLAAVLMGLFVKGSYSFLITTNLKAPFSLAISVIIGAISYLLFLLLTREFKNEELCKIPRVGKWLASNFANNK